jgi:hypothetical protein
VIHTILLPLPFFIIQTTKQCMPFSFVEVSTFHFNQQFSLWHNNTKIIHPIWISLDWLKIIGISSMVPKIQ